MLKQKAKKIITGALGPGTTARDGLNLAVSCPSCDPTKRKKKLSIRLDDFRYHCWVCGLKGKSIWKYISKNFPNTFIDPAFLKKRSQETLVEEKISLELPAGFVPLNRKSKDPDVVSVRKYLLKRGFGSREIDRWRLLTCPSGRFRRRVIVPSFDTEGSLNYFVGRSIDQGGIKYMNSKVPKTEIVFNEIDIDWKKTVVLVEGVFDAAKSVENTVPLLGSSLPVNSRLFRKLMKNQTNVIVSLDPDLKQKAYKIARDLHEAGCSVKISFTPEGKDMGDLCLEENRRILESAKFYSPYSSLSHKISSIRSGSII